MSHAGVNEPWRGGRGPGYVEGELILKLIPSAGNELEESLRAAKPPTATGLAWLDELNARYGVTKIEPVFSKTLDPHTIQHRYPQRTKRAQPGAQIPSLAHVYKLTLQQDTDLRQAIADYSAQPDVTYAQPTYLVTGYDAGALR